MHEALPQADTVVSSPRSGRLEKDGIEPVGNDDNDDGDDEDEEDEEEEEDEELNLDKVMLLCKWRGREYSGCTWERYHEVAERTPDLQGLGAAVEAYRCGVRSV